jgi:hypothetical protein
MDADALLASLVAGRARKGMNLRLEIDGTKLVSYLERLIGSYRAGGRIVVPKTMADSMLEASPC